MRDSSPLQLGDAIANPAAIELERALARTLATDATAYAVATTTTDAQTRREVAQPRDLDLQPGLARARVTMKDLEDHRRAIEDIDARRALEVRVLGRRQLVVDDDDRGARGWLDRGGI